MIKNFEGFKDSYNIRSANRAKPSQRLWNETGKNTLTRVFKKRHFLTSNWLVASSDETMFFWNCTFSLFNPVVKVYS